MGAWHTRPQAYPHKCVTCERDTPETGPFHRGATINVALRGGMGEVPFTLWMCRVCMGTAMHGELSPFQGWGPNLPVVPYVVDTIPDSLARRDEQLKRLKVLLDEMAGEVTPLEPSPEPEPAGQREDELPSHEDVRGILRDRGVVPEPEPEPVKRGPGRPRKQAA